MVTGRHDYLDAVKDLLVEALGPRLAPGVRDYLDLFTEDGVLETPYAPEATRRVVGAADLAEFVESLRGYVVLTEMRLRGNYPTGGDVVVLEYDGQVRQPRAGVSFEQSYVAVIRTRDGRVALFREYSDPQRAATAARSSRSTP